LLFGVTGSGKTEVYLRLVEQALLLGRQVLLLVPEINLTPQLEDRVRGRFPGAHVVSLHSELAEAARERNWRSAFAGEADLVLGTRLSIFTPLPRLGADHRRRGARCLVQAAGRHALFGARRCRGPCPPVVHPGAARFGDAVAGKLGQRPGRPLPAADLEGTGQSRRPVCRPCMCSIPAG
jgi:hypothetical protein